MSNDLIGMGFEQQFTGYPDIFHAAVSDSVSEFEAVLGHRGVWTSSPMNATRSAFDGMTALHLTCVHGSRNVFNELVAFGELVDPFVVDDLGRMAIDYALAFRRDDMARTLQAMMYPDGFAKLRAQGITPSV